MWGFLVIGENGSEYMTCSKNFEIEADVVQEIEILMVM